MKACLVILLFTVQMVFGQAVSLNLVTKTPLKADKYIGTDDYGNIYFVQENIFYKKETDKTYQFSDLQLGKLTSVDILNPLKITLFYQNMNTVVFVDRHLIDINRINFNLLPNFRSVGYATTASNNSLWIFNRNSQQLEIFDYLQKEVLSKSQPVDQDVIVQKSNFNFCWLLTSKTFKLYNSYGSLLLQIPNENFTDLEENNGRLIAKKENELFYLGKNSKKFRPLKIPEMDIQTFYLNDENLYLYDGEFLYRFHLDLTN